jgi:adenylosuccinate lyase
MNWLEELEEAVGRLRAREHARVGFEGAAGTVGALGREFNALAEELEPAGDLNREQAHRLRNRLAGILAALHVLGESDELPADGAARLARIRTAAAELEARLRAR